MTGAPRSWITALRWVVLAAGCAASTGHFLLPVDLGAAALGAQAGWRTVRPTQPHRSSILADFVLVVAVAAATGGLRSPYLLSLTVPLLLAGASFGLPAVFALAGAALAVVDVPGVRHGAFDLALFLQWAQELLLVGAVGTFARRMTAAAQGTNSTPRLALLEDLNQLLVRLYRATETQPVSLALAETVRVATDRLRADFSADVLLVLLRDATGTWSVAFSEGVPATEQREDSFVWRQALAATARRSPVLAADLERVGGGVVLGSGSGAYAALHVRDELVGAVVMESRQVGRFGRPQAEALATHAAELAVAVDNSRWFGRLRLLGVERERGRLARDLHDRVAQSLVYLGIEAENLAQVVPAGPPRDCAYSLASRIRDAAGEVRETISDLRADVSDHADLVATIDRFVQRLRRRSAADVMFWHYATHRLPLAAEREVWRIAQEAMTNAERHAGATRISVLWLCEDGGAVLEVADDGRGITAPVPGRFDSYGLIGIRERADAIGGALEIDSRPGAGTTLRLRLGGTP